MLTRMLPLLISILAVSAAFLISGTAAARAECDLVGTAHGDNHKSESKGKEMIKDGASACDLARAYDEHKADFKISEKEMMKSDFYKNADSDLKKELKDYAKEGHGADGMVGYEVKDAIEETN